MQTFLPYADFAQSMASLDDKRLGKQRVEAYQILLQLGGLKMADYPDWQPRLGGWGHHPAVAMWAGHEIQLAEYIRVCCDEWTSRGSFEEIEVDGQFIETDIFRNFTDTVKANTEIALELVRQPDWTDELPAWIGTEAIHRTHRSNLLNKDFDYYGSKFPEDIPKEGEGYLEYIWPKTEFVPRDRMVANYEHMVQKKIANF